ncbi:molybdopterin-dependent oxidoreductase [Hominibacterium faecale]|uniref:molybdopterin-dependent oxidoreductase n=1 Tax=Hominibacterium faecale TaxID=2839743 RepID=UPI0022B296EA|nr:molybdopterin cofactor-binding domain-containing protein [Hominibacterium faecale]
MGMNRIVLTINGAERSLICDMEKDTLADVLRNLGLTGTKVGCGKGQCGACNVILNGKLTRSCTLNIKRVPEYSRVETIEGIGTANNLHPLQLAWIVYGGVQCGFCSPGFILSAKALLETNPSPTREEVRDWFQKNRNACRCTGYKPLVDGVMAAAEVMRGEKTMDDLYNMIPEDQVFDTRYPKPTALGKVLGTTDYGDDISLKVPDMLHLAPVMPTISHGLLKSVDTAAAEKAEGVVKVITAKDVPGTNRIVFPIGTSWADGGGSERPIICDEKVFRRGDVIALVVADTRRHARDAAKLVTAEYEQLPEYLDALDAVAEDALEIHPGMPNEFLRKARFHGEDTRQTLPKSAHQVELSVRNQTQPHMPIEPDTANAYIDGDGRLTIMFKTHALYMQKGFIASGLGIDPENIRLILNPSGGSFGYAFSPGTIALVGLASLLTGSPCTLTFSYEEHQAFTGKRPPTYQNVRIGCDEKGKITAAELDILYDNGCYSEAANSGALVPTKYFMTPYTTPSARVLSRTTFSNTPFNTAYRCPAAANMYTGQEQAMDMLAEKMGMDPMDFRLLNVWQEGDTAIYGEKPTVYVAEGIFKEMKPIYEKLKKHAAENTTEEKKYGAGVAFGSFNISNSGDHAEIALELNPDGTVTHYSTWEDMGQGADVGCLAYTHEALKPLGLKPEQIHIVMSDTDTCPDTGRAAASRCNLMTGQATDDGAKKMLDAMRKEDGTYRTYDEMVAEGLPTRFVGAFTQPVNEKLNENDGFGKFPPDQSYAGFVCEVEVDAATGKTKVIAMHCVSDVGKVTNWLSLEGQAFGGMMHSIGYALSENYYDFKKHNNLIGSGFPFIKDIPDGENFTLTNLETVRDYAAFGGTGISEGYQSAGHVAVLNALYAAVGVRIGMLPATPDKVKAAMEAKANGTYKEQEPFFFGKDFHEYLDYIKAHPRIEYKGAVVHH